MDNQIKLLLENLENRIEQLENRNSENYCYFCKFTYHKSILKCTNCEKNICNCCKIERNGYIFCKRKCCIK